MKAKNLAVLVGLTIAAAFLQAQASSQQATIDTASASHPFPHFWEQTFGSGRAILTLRDNYRKDLSDVHELKHL